ncbi:MAG TPA: hypothetical protein PK177_23350, partial [Burkholderiaceae bacterium]|nr:hypothetical protein [Burkholderiaceae bacterium]
LPPQRPVALVENASLPQARWHAQTLAVLRDAPPSGGQGPMLLLVGEAFAELGAADDFGEALAGLHAAGALDDACQANAGNPLFRGHGNFTEAVA